MKPVIVATAVALALAATVAVPGDGSAGKTPATFATTIYFVNQDAAAPLGVRRTLVRRSPLAQQALAAVLVGPTPAERKRGLLTAIPRRARLISFRLERRRTGTDAFVNLTGIPPIAGVPPGKAPSVLLRVRVLTQVARTLIGLSDIARVWMRVDGRPWDLPRMDGRLGDGPTDYDRLRGWWRICSAERTASERAAALSRCFSALP